MTDTFVWMVTKTEVVDESNVIGLHWRCELFTDEGKAGETTGECTLGAPIAIEDFAQINIEDMRALIFSNVDKAAVETALKGTA